MQHQTKFNTSPLLRCFFLRWHLLHLPRPVLIDDLMTPVVYAYHQEKVNRFTQDSSHSYTTRSTTLASSFPLLMTLQILRPPSTTLSDKCFLASPPRGVFSFYPSSMETGTADRITDSPHRRRQREEIDKKSCSPPPPVPLDSI